MSFHSFKNFKGTETHDICAHSRRFVCLCRLQVHKSPSPSHYVFLSIIFVWWNATKRLLKLRFKIFSMKIMIWTIDFLRFCILKQYASGVFTKEYVILSEIWVVTLCVAHCVFLCHHHTPMFARALLLARSRTRKSNETRQWDDEVFHIYKRVMDDDVGDGDDGDEFLAWIFVIFGGKTTLTIENHLPNVRHYYFAY